MEPTQLKADLSMINTAVGRADVPDAVKVLFREVIAWNVALVDQATDLDLRLDGAEAALDELIDGGGEMIMPETAAQILGSLEHGQLLCQANLALIEGPLGATMDEMSKKRFAQLIENAQRGYALATQIITELIAEEEDSAPAETDEEETDGGDDGAGDDGDADDVGDDEEAAHE